MKTFLILIFMTGISCATATADTRNHGTSSTPKDRPVVGMTKETAKAYYGAPFTQMALRTGERWYYRLKFSEVYGRAMVPFYYSSPNVRWGSIDFGPDGRARSFDWHPPILRD